LSKVILTADRGTFTDYGGTGVLGYVACMPYRLVPRLFIDKFFAPPMRTDKNGRALLAPYPVRKVEATLLNAGIDVTVTTPEKVDKVVHSDTKVVGVTTHDPLGIEPVTFKLTMLFGGGMSWTAKFFEELGEKLERLKAKYGFKVIVGGPGSWQLEKNRPPWVDVVFVGHAELDLPPLVRKIERGEEVPKVVYGRRPRRPEEIPPIVNPARLGEVQVTRGCPRGCHFCSITPDTFMSIPLETIIKEVQVNVKAGAKRVDLITDDIMLYGSQKLRVNHDAIVSLFSKVMESGVDSMSFAHISAPPVKESPRTVRALAEIARYEKDRGNAPVVGLETGSERIFVKYMNAKSFPYRPSEWGDVVIDATAIMNDNFIYPCYTMTIGYVDETDEDVEQSIKLVEKITDHDFTAWIFPLPVIPMGTSRIRENPLPVMEKLPSRYWDLLYLSWKYDLKVTRKVMPTLTGGIKSKLIRRMVQSTIDKVFSNIEWIFKELKETKGMSSLRYRDLNLNTTVGVLQSIYWLFRASAKPL
jgi:radical SAM superfamily enzyme YgiQ (UPF0313 family)